MTDKNRVKRFASQMGLKVAIYAEPKYICGSAIKEGAVESICLFYGSKSTQGKRFFADLNFEMDKDGNCIGFSTDQYDSFISR